MSHTGASIQRWRIVAPATASMARTIAQKYQYSQPTVNPAHGPSAWRQYSTNEPPHDEHDQRAGRHVGQHGGRAGLVHDRAAADEQPGPDHPAERDHRHVARLERALELGLGGGALGGRLGLRAHGESPFRGGACPRAPLR
jgi:hypothetical protein